MSRRTIILATMAFYACTARPAEQETRAQPITNPKDAGSDDGQSDNEAALEHRDAGFIGGEGKLHDHAQPLAPQPDLEGTNHAALDETTQIETWQVNADVVMTFDCVGAESLPDTTYEIVTRFSISTVDLYKGINVQSFTLPGGILGNLEVVSAHAPAVAVGERYIGFFRRDPNGKIEALRVLRVVAGNVEFPQGKRLTLPQVVAALNVTSTKETP